MAQHTRRIPVERMTDEQIADRLEADGYDQMIGREAEIREAARDGCLLWTQQRLTIARHGGRNVDVRPERY